MNTKYGQISDISLNKHFISLSNRIWQLIPLKEEDCKTLDNKIDRLNREISGFVGMMDCPDEHIDEHLLSVICLLEHLKVEDDFRTYRSDVFRCCDVIRKVGDELG